MSLKLIQTIDVYYTHSQLKTMYNEYFGETIISALSDFLLGDAKDALTKFICKKAGIKSYALANPTVTAALTVYDISSAIADYIDAQKLYHAIRLLEKANLNGAVRFRTKVYRDDSDSKPLVFVGESAVTYNSNY